MICIMLEFKLLHFKCCSIKKSKCFILEGGGGGCCNRFLSLEGRMSKCSPDVPARHKLHTNTVFPSTRNIRGSDSSPDLCTTDRSPTASPSSTPAKHIWMPNRSVRFFRQRLLLRRLSITPAPPAAIPGIPWTTTRVMASFCRPAVRRQPPRWWSKDRTNWDGGWTGTPELLGAGRPDRLTDGRVKRTALNKNYTSGMAFQNKTQTFIKKKKKKEKCVLCIFYY